MYSLETEDFVLLDAGSIYQEESGIQFYSNFLQLLNRPTIKELMDHSICCTLIELYKRLGSKKLLRHSKTFVADVYKTQYNAKLKHFRIQIGGGEEDPNMRTIYNEQTGESYKVEPTVVTEDTDTLFDDNFRELYQNPKAEEVYSLDGVQVKYPIIDESNKQRNVPILPPLEGDGGSGVG